LAISFNLPRSQHNSPELVGDFHCKAMQNPDTAASDFNGAKNAFF
jgi:hypothetical protein